MARIDASTNTLLRPGDLLAERYRILGLVGRGGMAEVYAAHHEILQQKVAIKVLLPAIADAPESRMRFLNEARAAVRIRGEHIVAVLDVGSLPNGSPFMVLEFLEGCDLESYIRARGPLPVEEAVDCALEALQALAQAHANGIIHRDVKPSNLFLAEQPDGSRVVKVLDFGISKVLQPAGASDVGVTMTFTLLGSPAYMAPEQARDAKSVDARADVWAMGVVLYRLLAGVVPFAGASMTDTLLAITQDEPRPLREHRPDVPAELEGVIHRCLSKPPANRYADVASLALSLQSFGGTGAAWVVERTVRALSATARSARTPAAAPPPTLDADIVTGSAVASAAGTPSVPSPSPVLRTATAHVPLRTFRSWAESSAPAPRANSQPETRSVARTAVRIAAGLIALGAVAGLAVRAGGSLGSRPSVAAPAPPSAGAAPASPPAGAAPAPPPAAEPPASAAPPAPAASGTAAPGAVSDTAATPAATTEDASAAQFATVDAGHAPSPATTLPPSRSPSRGAKPAPPVPQPTYDVLNLRN